MNHLTFRAPARVRQFVALLAVLAAGGCAVVPEQVHRVIVDDRVVSEASADVQITRAGASNPVTPGTTLEVGDVIATGANSQAVLLLENGKVEVVMLENTEVRISSTFLNFGEIFVRVRDTLRDVFEVPSDYGVAGVEGTVFTVSVQRDRTADRPYQCTILEGQVEVRSANQAWAAVTLRGGDSIAAGSTAPPTQRKIDRREFNDIVERMNRIERVYRPNATELLVSNVVGLTEAEAQRVLRDQGLSIGEAVGRVSGNAPIGQVLAQRPAAGSWSKAGGAVRLDVEAEPTTVPQLVGIQEAAAEHALVQAKLTKGDVSQQITGQQPEGQVLRQRPPAGETVPVDSSVDLWVEAESVNVPELVNLSLDTARQRLTDNGLAAGRVRDRLVRSGEVGQVLEQSVAANTAVAPGTRVDLVVSVRGVAVPNLSNQTLASARGRLGDDGLRIGRTTTRRSNAEPDRVIDQSPSAGTLVEPGDSVDVVTESGCSIPNVMEMHRNAASSALSSAGLRPFIRNVGRFNSDNVTRQTPSGGTVRCGTTVTLDLGTDFQ